MSIPDSPSELEPEARRHRTDNNNKPDEDNDGSFGALFAPDPIFLEIARTTNEDESEDNNGNEREQGEQGRNQRTLALNIPNGGASRVLNNTTNNTTNNTAVTFAAAVSTMLEHGSDNAH